MKVPQNSQRDAFLVAQIAAVISVISFFYQLQHGNVLLYGDAVAHVVVDVAEALYRRSAPRTR